MLSLVWRSLLQALTLLPLLLVGGLRRLQLRGRGAITVKLGGPAPSLAQQIALHETLAQLAADPAITAVVLDLDDLQLGLGALVELRDRLLALRKAGKKLFVHTHGPDLRALYLASVAHRVWMTPAGEAHLAPLQAQLLFYGGLLERLGVEVDMEAAGAFKSFAEPYTRRHPSGPNREATRTLLTDLEDQLLAAIAEGRGLSESAVREALAVGLLPAEDLRARGLIDALAYPDAVDEALADLLGPRARRPSLRAYARLARWERRLRRLGQGGPDLAIVHLEGPILQAEDERPGRFIDPGRVVPLLEALRQDDDTRAVILYVNSPGGSALASDLIARAVTRLGEKKPVIALFGDVSASGGYYLAAPAAEIIAGPATITGSIGVVGGKISIGGALARLGVFAGPIAASGEGNLFDPLRPFTPAERATFRAMLDRTYARFLQVVAGGRRRPVEAIRPHAEGRVWTGRAALARGLVDRLGGLSLAIDRARLLAGLPADGPAPVHLRFAPSRFALLRPLLFQGLLPHLPLPPLLHLLRRHGHEALALLPFDPP